MALLSETAERLGQVFVFVNEDVEGVIVNVGLGGFEILEEIEVRLTVRRQRDKLAIEHRAGREVVEGFCNEVEFTVQDVLTARIKCCFAARAHRLKPVAIELNFLCCVGGYVVLHSLTSFLVRSDAFWRNIIDRSHSLRHCLSEA